MNWKSLLTDKRLGVKQTSDLSDLEGRSQFQKDFDRVVFSPAFRRLQDKTQVFPLPESDFVHTRLTHSLEVSVVGRSLGNLVGREILKRHSELKDEFTQYHFGEIVAAACLAHDIGNPPFGHSGEDAISEYFRKGNGRKYEAEIDNVKRWFDLTNYEGNAQGFRIITRLQNPDVKGGLRLTFATLAAFTKYPKESYSPEGMEKSAKQKVYKKFGFFQSEREIFGEIAEATELDCKRNKEDFWWCRHPLAFLVESADDVCYRVMDLEDGFRLGLMSFKDTEDLLIPLMKKDDLTGYKGRDEKEKIGYLRSRAIRDQVNELAETFLENEKKILDGKLEDDLITITKSSKQLKLIKDVSIEKIYRTRSVVEREVAGYEVLGGLLDTFITAYNESYEKHLSPKNRAVINLLPARITSETNVDLYIRLLRVIDFVSGMTDSFAVSLFRKIKGISLPGRI